MWVLFAAGWVILFLGAWSFGIRDLLGIEQMRALGPCPAAASTASEEPAFSIDGCATPYVGVLMGVWATPRMSLGHALLALRLYWLCPDCHALRGARSAQNIRGSLRKLARGRSLNGAAFREPHAAELVLGARCCDNSLARNTILPNASLTEELIGCRAGTWLRVAYAEGGLVRSAARTRSRRAS